MTDLKESCSLQLSNILDVIIDTEDSIHTWRIMTNKANNDQSFDIFGKYKKSYRFGSVCEGLMLERSDYDIMNVHEYLPVIDNGTDITPPANYLLACSSASTSVYMFIEMHIQLQNGIPDSMIDALCHSAICYNDRILVSSSLFLQHYLPGNTVGPSHVNASPADIDTDNVQAFHSKTLPYIANEWIYRKRKYSWPSSHVISLSKAVGYHLVPVGDYNTNLTQFQWRISFVLQECLLVRSFSYFQMQVYALMKMIKTEVLSAYKSQDTGDSLITSYHIKTLMFWTIECTPKYMWCENNLILCIQICMMFLKRCVKSNFTPHYFMPQCNLFKKHVLNDLSNVIIHLSNYAKNPLSEIVAIPPIMKELSTVFNAHQTQLRRTITNLHNIIYSKVNLISFANNAIGTVTIVRSLLTTVQRMKEYEWFVTYGWLLSAMLTCIQASQTPDVDGDKSLYKQYRKAKRIALLFTHLDISTGWLILSSHLYQTHNYEKCCEITYTKVILPITQFAHVIYCGRIRDYGQLEYTLTHGCRQMSFPQQCKHLTCITFDLHQNMVPCELNIEAALYLDYGIKSIVVTPLPYAYFQAFLCAYHLHDERLQLLFLHLLQSIEHDEYIGPQKATRNTRPHKIVLNMLGICYELMGDISNAAYYYGLSAKDDIRKHITDAANIRLLIMMIKKHPSILEGGNANIRINVSSRSLSNCLYDIFNGAVLETSSL